MACSAMVPNAVIKPDKVPNPVANGPGATRGPVQSETPPNGSKKATTSHLESVRKQHRADGISEKASKLITSG